MFDNLKFLLVKKYVLGWLVQGYRALRGHKTTIITVVAVGVWVAEVFGYLPHDTAKNLYQILGGSGTITILQKLQRWQDQAESLAGEVKTMQ